LSLFFEPFGRPPFLPLSAEAKDFFGDLIAPSKDAGLIDFLQCGQGVSIKFRMMKR